MFVINFISFISHFSWLYTFFFVPCKTPKWTLLVFSSSWITCPWRRCTVKRIHYFSIYPSTQYRKRKFYLSRFVSVYTRPLGTGRGSSISQGLFLYIPVHSVQEEEVLSLKVCFCIYPSTRYRKRKFYPSRFVFIRESDTSAYTRPLGTGRGSSIPQGLLLQHIPVHSVQEEEVLSLKVCYFIIYPSTLYRKRKFYP